MHGRDLCMAPFGGSQVPWGNISSPIVMVCMKPLMRQKLSVTIVNTWQGWAILLLLLIDTWPPIPSISSNEFETSILVSVLMNLKL